MKLSIDGIRDRSAWEAAGISLPSYDVSAVHAKAVAAPRWAHFGIGNIFRIFIGGIADGLIAKGALDRGLTCIETFDYDVVDRIYAPYDNLSINVLLFPDGKQELSVVGALGEAVKAQFSDPASRSRMEEIFTAPSLQMVSFTITEKGYALKAADGTWLPYVRADIENGPEQASGAMAIVTAMLYARYKNGQTPIALVSMDNISTNGALLRNAVLTMAEAWLQKGFVEEDFLRYVSDESRVSFPWTMIDKITPRPAKGIADELEALGVEAMQPIETSKRTYIAPFVNGEDPQYLVIEDSFPNGRPALEQGKGVFMADRDTVNKAERMKVTACVNPVHSGTGPIGVVLGLELFANMLLDEPDMMKLARSIAYDEGLPVVVDPVILSPKAIIDQAFTDRFPNIYLGDTNLRLSTDVSQGVGVRFGETIKAYTAKYGTAGQLTAIPLGIAGWLRYMLGVDDFGKPYTLAPDPMNETFREAFRDVKLGSPDSLQEQLKPILSNENIFRIDLYRAGLGEKIEGMFREMIAGPGATRETIHKYMADR